MHLYILKAHGKGFVTDLKPGDKVRIDDTALFKKRTENRCSDEVHVVKEASGKTVTLTDGTTHDRRNKILMAPHNKVIAPTAQQENHVIKVATKQHKRQAAIQEREHQRNRRNRRRAQRTCRTRYKHI